MRSVPFACVWKAGFQKLSGTRLWQVKKPMRGSAGSRANASEKATVARAPSGSVASRWKWRGA